MSLRAPEGIFLSSIQRALQKLAQRSKSKRGDPIIVRIMLSNYLAKPCDCTEVIETLTKDLPEGANLHIWVRDIMGGNQTNFDDLDKSWLQLTYLDCSLSHKGWSLAEGTVLEPCQVDCM